MKSARIVLAGGVFAVGSLAVAPVASAHDALVGSNPQNGGTVTAAPQQVELTFNNSVTSVGNQIAVTGPDGNQVTATAKVSGNKVSAPFKPVGNGQYKVLWRVTSSDGHPISGNLTFTLKGQPNSTAAPSSSGPSAANSSPRASTSASTVSGPSTPTLDEPGDNKPWLVGGGIALTLAVIGAGAYLAKGRVKDDPRR